MEIGTDQTLHDWLGHHAKARPDAIALESAGTPVSYGELASDVARLRGGLTRLGVGRGDVVGAQLPNTRDFLTCFLAVTGVGAIFQTLHMPYRWKELREVLSDAGAKAVIVTHSDMDSRAEELHAERHAIPTLQQIICTQAGVDGTVALAELMAGALAETADLTAADPFLLLYTSGTTSKPKGVPHLYGRFLNNALVSAGEMGIDATSRVMSLAPMTHLYGLFTLHMALSAGATQVLAPAFNPATVLDKLRAGRPSHVYAAPAHFAGLVAANALEAEALESIEILCLSGAAVPRALAEALQAKIPQGAVVQLWGMSELQAGSYGRASDPLSKRVSTCGRASPRTELRVVDEGGALLPPGTEGILQVRGPSVFEGYLNRPEESLAAFGSDGWFSTGDLAVIDADGFLTHAGRTKEVINRGGVKYNPVEVEELVSALPGVLQCVVVPVADALLGERGCLCAVLAPKALLTLDDVTAHLSAAGMAKYKWPEELAIFDKFPMTPTQKVMRTELRTAIENRKDKDQ